ncbi:MAG: hypothetical protein PHE53_00605 [Thermoguttaceae bacterium]|nr:hypothetical protein [Thermoguttaceae bacterium]
MRQYLLGAGLTVLLLCTGCSICCTPYDECGPTALSGRCNTRAGSALAYSGPQGNVKSSASSAASSDYTGNTAYAGGNLSQGYDYAYVMPDFVGNTGGMAPLTAQYAQPMASTAAYEPSGQPQTAAIPETLQQRYPAGSSLY